MMPKQDNFATEFFSTFAFLSVFLSQWNISDYLYQNRDKIREGLEHEAKEMGESQPDGIEQTVPPFDALWLTLYSRHADLCVDSRPAVRKSAGQTLFSTISAHGALLKLSTWQIVLWQVSSSSLSDFVHFCSCYITGRSVTKLGKIQGICVIQEKILFHYDTNKYCAL